MNDAERNALIDAWCSKRFGYNPISLLLNEDSLTKEEFRTLKKDIDHVVDEFGYKALKPLVLSDNSEAQAMAIVIISFLSYVDEEMTLDIIKMASNLHESNILIFRRMASEHDELERVLQKNRLL